MKEDREAQVKQGISLILEDAHSRFRKGANFEIGVVGFNHQAFSICEPTSIQFKSAIEQSVQKYSSSGGTNIKTGLDAALGTIKKTKQQTAKALILLTDGEDDNLKDHDISKIKSEMGKLHANLFAIGIGKEHRQELLRKIAGANYIDTANGNQTIIGAISQIYKETISQYSNLRLSCSTLQAGTWSVDGDMSDQHGGCSLKSLPSDQTMLNKVKIHSKKLSSDVDLSKLVFDLSFTDCQGNHGKLPLPWAPNPTIDSKLLKTFH